MARRCAQWWLAACVVATHAAGAAEVIEYYGDSTVWGYESGTGRQVARPAPAVFADLLPRAMYEVRNEGVSGATACDLLNGTDGRHAAWPQQMARSTARYVLVNYGINDQWKHDMRTYASCLRALAQIARQHGKQMIFETPNPTRDSGSGGLDAYVDAMREVAAQQQIPVIDQYRYLSEQLNGRPVSAFCPDGLHPSEAVYAMKGRYAATVFMRLFKPPR